MSTETKTESSKRATLLPLKSCHSDQLLPTLDKLKSMKSVFYKLYPSIYSIQKGTIHQIWLQGEQHLKQNRPHFYKDYIEYKHLNNNKHCLWSEEMIESLIVHEYPHLLILYHSYSHFIMRVDLAKYIILHYYGGFYVDMDTKCKLNFHSLTCLTNNNKPVVCRVDDDLRTTIYARKFINNHFFYLPNPHHPLMNILLNEAPFTAKRRVLEPMVLYILRAIGPGFLMHCIKIYKKQMQKVHNNKKLNTSDVVTIINSSVLNKYFNHQSKNTWLEDEWMDKKDYNDYQLVISVIITMLGMNSIFVFPLL